MQTLVYIPELLSPSYDRWDCRGQLPVVICAKLYFRSKVARLSVVAVAVQRVRAGDFDARHTAFEKQFVVTTDVSDVAVGVILEQNFGSGLQPIAFASRKLNATEIRYSASKREMLGILWALGEWKHYFQSPHPIIIQTDHAPLRLLPNQTSVNSSLALDLDLTGIQCGNSPHPW